MDLEDLATLASTIESVATVLALIVGVCDVTKNPVEGIQYVNYVEP